MWQWEQWEPHLSWMVRKSPGVGASELMVFHAGLSSEQTVGHRNQVLRLSLGLAQSGQSSRM